MKNFGHNLFCITTRIASYVSYPHRYIFDIKLLMFSCAQANVLPINITIYRTDTAGTIVACSDGTNLTFKTEN